VSIRSTTWFYPAAPAAARCSESKFTGSIPFGPERGTDGASRSATFRFVSSGATSVSGMARRRRSRRIAVRRAVLGVGVVALLSLLALTLVAGSPGRLPAGTTIAGYEVGGMDVEAARQVLQRRSDALAHAPLQFVVGGRTFAVTPSQLGVRPDWTRAVRSAADAGNGFAPVRGLKRLQARLFGSDVDPHVDVYPSAVRFTVARIAKAVDKPAVDAGLERRGLRIVTTPARAGVHLDRARASTAIVAALASLDRQGPVRLTVARTEPKVGAERLTAAAAAARTAISAPVTLTVGPTRFRLARWRIAQLLELPTDGSTRVGIGGPPARAWLTSLARSVDRPPRDATFRVVSGGIEVVPARLGRALDVEAARAAVEKAMLSPTNRAATVATTTSSPARTTAAAEAMGITGIVGSYTTTYGGTPGRLHNVQLVADLIDGALVAPGKRFSFNQTTGERNAAKGFEEAPVIINGELESGIGGGVCQVSTTVFNAAFEAGLSIDKRTNHALYISHYPLGRDATVNYPDIDLVFTNDTDKWLLVRTFVGAGSLTVNIYGTPQHRRVETETAPLQVDGKVPWKRIDDDTMFKGQKVVEQWGAPPRSTSVTRRVYEPDGALLYNSTWHSYYSGEPTVVRLGTKPRPKPTPAEPPASATTGDAAGKKAGDGAKKSAPVTSDQPAAGTTDTTAQPGASTTTTRP
jgi:vancomycin resistance protein YoaR